MTPLLAHRPRPPAPRGTLSGAGTRALVQPAVVAVDCDGKTYTSAIYLSPPVKRASEALWRSRCVDGACT